MDKRKVIAAYRRGFITIQECSQILGVDTAQMLGLVNDPKLQPEETSTRKLPVNT
ncbi:hypothetical protein [Paenibacillus swuensis]|uniref:hypothetical protein n=1 Tax=Paenibacillus swuensis TaxID=1178515 RepID=UPI000A481A54|nr:hypothetical protein [Paenibacillus swuensis]